MPNNSFRYNPEEPRVVFKMLKIWNTTSIEDDLNGRWPQWKTISRKDHLIKDDLNVIYLTFQKGLSNLTYMYKASKLGILSLSMAQLSTSLSFSFPYFCSRRGCPRVLKYCIQPQVTQTNNIYSCVCCINTKIFITITDYSLQCLQCVYYHS